PALGATGPMLFSCNKNPRFNALGAAITKVNEEIFESTTSYPNNHILWEQITKRHLELGLSFDRDRGLIEEKTDFPAFERRCKRYRDIYNQSLENSEE
ncbi:MAG: hypothetical protein OIF38_06170, partial [Cellvibrionaceae bacterium]|nr:hypothetical protein [Cellvibrionaceae bacterium]